MTRKLNIKSRSTTLGISIIAAMLIIGIDRGVSGKTSSDAPRIRFVNSSESVANGKPQADRSQQFSSLMRSEPVELLHDAKPARVNLLAGPSVIQMQVTAYCACKKCCGAGALGLTASGKKVSYNNGRFVAADPSLPFGTKLKIPGYNEGQPVEVADRGGAIRGTKLDVFFPTHEQAVAWGRRTVAVTIVR
jgi:3D (Asp-Asp-Asp) domain-containing protein